jgi:hypothetical protein
LYIHWVNDVKGDFSFTGKWFYPEGIYMNDFGQLSCDGDCPIETDRMKDKLGKIIIDSLVLFYKLIDTTHIYQSINCETNSPQFLNAKIINCIKLHGDTVVFKTATNAATHSSLIFKFIKTDCYPSVIFNSIARGTTIEYEVKDGLIEIDKGLWQKHIFKSSFNINFISMDSACTPIFWKGNIYSSFEKSY